MYEKLTYSGTKCDNYLYFAFRADSFDTDVISEALKLQPTSVMIKGDPVPKSTSWKYEVNAGSAIDLVNYIEKLVAVFEPKMEEILQLKKQLNLTTRLQFVIDIDINPESSTPYFGMNKRTIDFSA